MAVRRSEAGVSKPVEPAYDVRVSRVVPLRHLAHLDGLRGLAALYVVAHHAMLNLPHPAQHSWVDDRLRNVTRFGHGAVDVFIVLSGYCLMLPVLRKGKSSVDIAGFLRRRFVRIVPTYYAAMLFSLALVWTLIGTPAGTHWDRSVPVTTRDIWLHVALVHDLFADSAARINHAFWSIAVEWKIYFLFPALLWARARFGTISAALGACGVGYAVWLVMYLLDFGNPTPWGSSPYYLGLFALGVAAADLAQRGALKEWLFARRGKLATAVVCWAAVIVVTVPLQLLPLQLVSLLVGGLCSVVLLGIAAGAMPRLAHAFAHPWLGKLGQFSFSLYLVHAPLEEVVHRYVVRPAALSPALAALLMVTLSMALSLAVAAVFYVVAERPFHALSRRV